MVAFDRSFHSFGDRDPSLTKAMNAAGPAGKELVRVLLDKMGVGPVLNCLREAGEKGEMPGLVEIMKKTSLSLPVVTAALVLLRHAGWAEVK